jgi:hypothetical protein
MRKIIKKKKPKKSKQPLLYRITESLDEMQKQIQSREDVDMKRKELRSK